MIQEMVRHFHIADEAIQEHPVILEDFNSDNDVVVIANVGLSREDLLFKQAESDTIIETADGKQLAILKNINAFDLDPVALLEKFYAALLENDTDAVLDYLADDVLWEVSGPTDIMPWAGGWQGRDQVANFFTLLSAGLSFEKLIPTSYIAQGNTVAVILDGSGETRAGIPYSGGVVHWVTVRGGKVSHLQYYRDTYPIMEAMCGGRPFTVEPSQIESHYHVIKPVAVLRDTDSIVFDTSLFETPVSTVKTVRAMYAALQGLNVPEVRKVFAEDVVWDIFGPADLLSWAGERIGPDAAAESANQIIETMHFDHFKPTRLIYQGDTAAIVIDEAGTSTVTGLPFQTSVVHIVVANEEGKVTLFKNYINTAWIVEAFLGGRPFTVH